MDRSFLFDQQVVEASRKFVCIRMATYEDKTEAEFTHSIYSSRSGHLENTVFVMLSPDGKRKLTRSGRSPQRFYRGADTMASNMNRIASQYPSTKKGSFQGKQLPLMKNLELALNVAAADGLPLIITLASDEKELNEINQKLVSIAWNQSIAGQFTYASVVDAKELKPIAGVNQKQGILVIQPDRFGLSGKVLAQFLPGEDPKKIQSTLETVIEKFSRIQKDHNSHVRVGIRLGIDWESEIPETDPMSVQAKQRARGRQ